jgi:hypothetical protein
MPDNYEEKALQELREWQKKMSARPSLTSRIAKEFQRRTNNLLPDKVHEAITAVIKNMVKAVLFGSELTANPPLLHACLEQREVMVRDKLGFYRKSAALSGAGTGAGGILLGVADFPILIGLKFKFLFEVASVYGFDVTDYRERLYILYIFQLAFSSQQRSREVYRQLLAWEDYVKTLPADMNTFDWRTFQQEYRDYIDLVKLLQLVPGIGAVVGAVANYRLMGKLGKITVFAYRLRFLSRQE